MDEIKASFWDGISVFSGKLITILLLLFSISMITRILGVANYGRLNLFNSIAQMFFLFGLNWTSFAMLKFGKEEFLSEHKINRVFWSRALILCPIIIISALSILIFKRQIMNFVGIENNLFILLTLLYVVSLLLSEYRLTVLQSINKLKLYSLCQPFERLLIIVGLLLIIFKIFEANVITVIVIFTAVNIVSTLPIMFLYRIYIFPVVVDFSFMKKMVAFSYPFIFSVINSYVFYWIGLILIKKYMGIDDVGIYSLAKSGGEVAEQLLMSTAVVTVPIMIAFAHKKNDFLINKYIQRVIPHGTIVISLGVSLMILFSGVIIRLIGGHAFEKAEFYFAGLLCCYVLSGIAAFYSPLLVSHNLIKEMVFIDFLAIVINIVLGFILIPMIGIPGAVIAIFIDLYFVLILRMFVIGKRFKIRTYNFLYLVLPVFFSFCLFAMKLNIYQFILGLTVLCLFYLYLKFKFNLFTKSDYWIVEQINMPAALKKMFLKS